ncbi:MAG: AAA family ATPase [Muricomes sp.]
MEIRELYLKNFGKFSEQHFFINKGIHIFYGENEYGKSTIYAFIKAMLFGLERGRGRAAQNDEFSRYEPWENPNYYAGVLVFTSGGKRFRLERQFDRYSRSASLICEDDGEEMSLEDGDLEMLLGQLTTESFENTAAIGQLTARPGQGLADELKNYAANYYESGSSTVNLNRALEVLRQRRKAVEREIKELSENQEMKRETIRQECYYVSNDIKKFQTELEYNEKKQKTLQVEHEGEKDNTFLKPTAVGVFAVLAGLCGIVWSNVILDSKVISVIFWTLLAAGVLFLCAGAVRYSRTGRKIYPTKYPVKERQEKEEDLRKLQWESQRIQSECREKQVILQNLQEQMAELELPGEETKKMRETQKALQLAEEKMLEASRNLVQGFGTMLNQNASLILEEITDGRYTNLLADEQLNMVLFKDGRRIPVERVSRGTMEQVYFSLRMAAMDLLYEEPMPVILDDAFAHYDEKRLKSTLKWLSRQKRQVIIFTCQKREQEIVKQF